MKKKYILALDQGTTSSRCVLFDRAGRPVKSAQREFASVYPAPGWVEQDPELLYSSLMEAMREVLAGIDPAEVDGIGLANQRETVIVWDRESGRPIYNAIVWQCRRTMDECARLRREGVDTLLYEKTGLETDAYFSATKLAWILDHVPGVRKRAEAGQLAAGNVDAFLLWRLTGGRLHATDRTNASRTMLYNIHTLAWDETLLRLFRIPAALLPDVFPSAGEFGTVAAGLPGGGLPLRALCGDQQAALFGHLCIRPGEVKNTYGTGCFLLMHTGTTPVRSKRGLLTSLAAGGEGPAQYVLEGSVFTGGAVVKWLRDGLGLVRSAADTEHCARAVPDTLGVYLVPALTGLGAPHWDAAARGLLCNLTPGVKKEHVVRAALEGIAYQVQDVFRAMRADAGIEMPALAVDGGASANNFLLQFQADILDVEVRRPPALETTARGAACLAGLHSGFYRDVEALRQREQAQGAAVFRPAMPAERRDALLLGWAEAVRRARAN